MSRPVLIAPSILAADNACFGSEARRVVEGQADWLHVDIMDGHFVPNISFGIDMLPMLRREIGSMKMDVHLMIERPDRYVRNFIEAGADSVTVHLEAEHDLARTLTMIRDMGCKVGLAINPLTLVEHTLPLLNSVDMLLCMTVNPGFGGQAFIIEVLEKVRTARRYCDEKGIDIDIQVDGGVNAITAGPSVTAGANVLVAGTYLFKQDDMKVAVEELRRISTIANSAG